MDTIQGFLGKRRKNYRWILNEYFREIKHDPDTYFKNKKKYDYKKDIQTWWEQHIDEVPKTRNTKLSVIHGLFDHYEVIYPKAYWLGLRKQKRGSRAATLDRVPTTTEFKTLLLHGTILDRAFFLFLSSSGIRPKELLQITLPMIDFDTKPVTISLPGKITKTGDPRITFISAECTSYLKEWLKIREKYINSAIVKTKHLCNKSADDNRVFPFSYDVPWTRWNNLLKKTGYDKRDTTTNRHVLHIYSLRKFFLSQMKLEVPQVVPEALAGHEEYLDDAYRRFSREELGEYYRKAESRLTILEAPVDLTGFKQELQVKDAEIKSLEAQVAELRNRPFSIPLEDTIEEIVKRKVAEALKQHVK